MSKIKRAMDEMRDLGWELTNENLSRLIKLKKSKRKNKEDGK